MLGRKTTAVLFLSLLLLLAVSLFSQPGFRTEISLANEGTPEVVAQSTPNKAGMMMAVSDNPYIIADIAEQVSPSIVYIQVEFPHAEREVIPRQADPFRDLFDHWFFSPMPQPQNQPRLGTGFIIDESGIVLTNQHVVGNLGQGQEITVTINSPDLSGDFSAELLGADSKLDLAVLQINDQELAPFPSVALGDSDTSRPGEWVIAIGNPYGKQFEHTVTVGVLSAKGREIAIRNQDTGAIQEYTNLMQTDAAINRGNSGGPLLNIAGEVIGINTAVHAQAQGIGFAIPINIAKDVLDELITTGGVEHHLPDRAWLGVWYQGINEQIATRLGLPDTKGVIVSDIAHNSPAQEAGLRPWDIIRRVENVDIETDQDFAKEISTRKPGDSVLLTVLRDGESLFIEVILANMPAEMRR